MVRHLALEGRRVVSLKVVYFDTLHEHYHLCEHAAEPDLRARILGPRGAVPVPSRLDEYVRVAVAEEVIADFADFSAAMNQRASNISCDECVDKVRTGAVCDGGENDHRVVHLGGDCIRWLKEIDAEVKLVARRCYEVAGLPGDLERVHLGTALLHVDDESSALLPLQGETSFDPEHVCVLLSPPHFDERNHLATAYVLLHEYIAHVFQRREKPSDRQTAEDDKWAEGWMDAVAFQVATDWLQGVKALRGVPAGRQLDAAMEYHLKRRSKERERLGQRHRKAARAAQLGVDAALNMLDLLCDLLPREDAVAMLIALSCRWNVRGLSALEEEQLIQTLNRVDYLSRCGPSAETYVSTRNSDEFLAALCALARRHFPVI